MENGPLMDDFPTKTSIYKGFSMAMLNNQRVMDMMTTKDDEYGICDMYIYCIEW